MLNDLSQTGVFAAELLACADPEKPNFVIVSADATSSLRLNDFLERYPERVVQVGIAEGCALAAAFGLAQSGLKTFVIGYSNFLLMRGMEVIRSYIGYHKADVTILGGMTGLTASYDGFMHQAIEDLAFMRAIEGMKIVVPSDNEMTRALARQCIDEPGPRYVRLVRREVVLPEALGAEGGLLWRVRNGQDVLLCSLGPLLSETVSAARALQTAGVSASVLEIGIVAPLPRNELVAAAAPFSRIVVVEDHVSTGGLGALIAEALSRMHRDIRRVNLSSHSTGSGDYESVLAAAGLTPDRIAAAALAVSSP